MLPTAQGVAAHTASTREDPSPLGKDKISSLSHRGEILDIEIIGTLTNLN